MRRKAARELGDIRIGKLNSQIIAEVSRDGDEQRVSRYLGKTFAPIAGGKHDSGLLHDTGV